MASFAPNAIFLLNVLAYSCRDLVAKLQICQTVTLPTKTEEKVEIVAEVNQRCRLEEREQCLENVDGTHLVLARGKLVLQKRCRYVHFLDLLSYYGDGLASYLKK